MYILVISDSHGRTCEIERVIEKHPDIRHIFFLGDCIRDVEDITYIYSDRTFHIVEGNCDGYSKYKSEEVLDLYGKRIFFTHGHVYGVKSGMERLRKAAETISADLVLYGHTHIPKTEYEDGRYFVNPGSLCSGRCGYTSYATVDITDQGIMPSIIRA